MNVGTYLQKKKGNVIFSINQNNTVKECVDLLNEKVGSLVVFDDDGNLQGIVSERDILRKGFGNEAASKKVSEIMTGKEKLITSSKEESIADVSAKLDENKVRHLPIMDGDKVIGIVSITDVINELRAIRVFENEQLKNYILSPY